MFKEALIRAFDDMFNHLGQEIQYCPRNAAVINVVAVIKQPENPYDLGGSSLVSQVAEVTIKSSEVTPKIGDILIIDSRKYKICEEPLLDASTRLYKFHAVLMKDK